MKDYTFKDVILQLAAMSGELSEVAIMQLHSSERYLTKLLWEMRKDNLIKRSDRDGTVGYRLSQSGKRYLKEAYPERYGNYFGNGGITSKVRLDGIHRQRYQRMSEVNALMFNIGAELFPGTKPQFDLPCVASDLFAAVPLAVDPLAVVSQSSHWRYYTSFEMKSMGDEMIKVNSSRAMGMLFDKDNTYLIYHTHMGPMKWEEMTEYRARMLLGHRLNRDVKSIVVGVDMDCALLLLESNGGRQNSYFRVPENIEQCMYFIPQNRYSEFLFHYAILTDAHNRMKAKVLTGLSCENGNCMLTCDGYADEKTGVLFACDFDMVKIMLFRVGLDIRKMSGIVYCFDFQAEVLRRYFGNNVSVRSIDSRKTAELFGIPL